MCVYVQLLLIVVLCTGWKITNPLQAGALGVEFIASTPLSRLETQLAEKIDFQRNRKGLELEI